MANLMVRRSLVRILLGCVVVLQTGNAAVIAESDIRLNVDHYDPACDIDVSQQGDLIQVTWPLAEAARARIVFDISGDHALIRSIERAAAGTERDNGPVLQSRSADFQAIATGLDPVLQVRVGDRDLDKRQGWTIFFDRMQRKPSETHFASIQPVSVTAESQHRRATVTIGDITAGPFQGKLRWTFYADNPFVLQEAVVSTERPRTAFLYDMGLTCRDTLPQEMVWRNSAGPEQSEAVEALSEPRELAVRGRAIAAGFERGSLAVFPPPHRYFYPLDFSNNFRNIWVGPEYGDQELPFGFGIRHDSRGDNRYVPWFNAPPGSQQELGLFLLLSGDSPHAALQETARLTRRDQFTSLPGHSVFTSHYHVEHTRELVNAQQDPANDDTLRVELPAGGEYTIPDRLEDPGFVRVFRDMGVDIVHLAEFHFGETPRWNQQQRVRHLQLLHAECRRLSDERFLLLPGEEPNVHLGGHWISFFPRPVHWVLNRPEGTPFMVEHPQLGRIYHVGDRADILRLLRAEEGLAWTAHPRIKGSTGFPDRYRDSLFFQSDRFLGAAWKAMPADLSQPRLGSRVLDLLDDMSNWGDPKVVPGEVDVFAIEPTHELYAHMNVNYLRLNEIPRFDDGWQPVLDALRGGQFFVTTGEVLIPEFTVNGAASGETAPVGADGRTEVRLDVEWTFPLSYAEIIMGDGKTVSRESFNLRNTGSHSKQSFRMNIDTSGKHWLRVEVWDVATNGAFTQPVWLQ